MLVKIVDTDYDKLQLIARIRAEGLEQALIYSLDTCSDEKWLDMLKYAWVLAPYSETGEPCGLAWFDNQNGKSAWCHYIAFKKYMSQAAEIGLQPIKWLEEKLDIKTLFGLTPKVYRHSRNLMEAWGFKELKVVQDGCYLARYKRYTDGIIYMRCV